MISNDIRAVDIFIEGLLSTLRADVKTGLADCIGSCKNKTFDLNLSILRDGNKNVRRLLLELSMFVPFSLNGWQLQNYNSASTILYIFLHLYRTNLLL